MKNQPTKILLSISMVIASISCFAQKPDKVLARVTYNFAHMRDTNNRKNPYTEQMLLIVAKNTSVFTSLDNIGRELQLAKSRPLPGAPFKPVTINDQYFFAKEHKMITRQRFMNAYYLIEEPIPEIKWKITRDTATFSGIPCKKAIAYFKGRNWIAWYAPEMPFQSGPWKLNSLPGLIIEAYDDKKEVIFQMARLDNLKKENLTDEEIADERSYEKSIFFNKEIVLQTDAKKTSRAEFDKVYALYLKDPKGFISAESGTPRNRIAMGTSMTGIVHNIINNPIELPEKAVK